MGQVATIDSGSAIPVPSGSAAAHASAESGAAASKPGTGPEVSHSARAENSVSVRYMIEDVPGAIRFYTTHLGFTLELDASPAFAAVRRGPLRLLLSGPESSGARPMRDGRRPVPGGWTRIQIPVADLAAEVARLQTAGVRFRNDIVQGVGGLQILLDDPSGNPVELWEAR